MWRPVAMTWIDLLVDRDAAGRAVQALGEMEIIELRRGERELPFQDLADDSTGSRIDALSHTLRGWEAVVPAPDPELVSDDERELPGDLILPLLEHRFADWRTRVQADADRLRHTRVRLQELELLARCLNVLPEHGLDLELFTTRHARRYEPFIALGRPGKDPPPDHAGMDLISRAYAPTQADPASPPVIVGLVDARSLADLERSYHDQGLRFVRVPETLRGSAAAARPRLQAMIDDSARLQGELSTRLEAVNTRTRIAGAVWLLDRHRWIHQMLRDALTGNRFVWLAGWIPAARYADLVQEFERRRIPFLARHGGIAGHGEPPVQLRNPAWVRHFEPFVRGFGMPGPDESDPSAALAIIAPLMFGYMFGDVGHGALLMLAGWLGRHRLPVLELLIPAGISSIAFGFLYGSLFCDEHLLPALWMRPLENPLLTLVVPVGFGILVLTLGMLLAALQARWSGRFRDWCARQLPLLVLYLAVPVAWVRPVAALAVAVLAGLGYLTAVAWQTRATPGIGGRAGAIVTGVAELIENAMQLAINTLSFARLGAFALAHAGLSSAVITLSAIPESGLLKAMVFVVGNIVVIALEGLVVSIQTTRLIMFEFFRRFFTGQGQSFRPLRPPQPIESSRFHAIALNPP